MDAEQWEIVTDAYDEMSLLELQRPTLSIWEHSFQELLLRALLTNGCTVMDTAAGVGGRSWRIKKQDGVLHTDLVEDMEMGSDIRVSEPTEVRIECKTKPDFGSKAQAATKEWTKDVQEVFREEGDADAFAFIFDEAIYTKLRGQRAAYPGVARRIGQSRILTTRFLPSVESLTEEYCHYSGRAVIERNPRYDPPLWVLKREGDYGESLAYLRIVKMPNLHPDPPRRRIIGVLGTPPEGEMEDVIPIPQAVGEN